MSTYLAQRPIYKLFCDRDDCLAEFETDDAYASQVPNALRGDARDAGWDVPPPSGKGSRRDTDFCPEHAEAGGPRG